MNKLTGVFFVLALVFGGIAYYEYENSKEEKVEKAREAQIIGWGQEELVSATLEKSGKLLKVERRDGDWWLVQPFEDMADQFNVNSWAGDIATEKGAKLDAKKTAAGDVFWAEYGLDRDLTILTIENESGDKAVVSFAKNAAFDGQFFSRYKNDVYIAVRPWAGVMAKSADNLRNRDVFRKKSKIEKVRMQVMGDDYTLIRAEGETWSMQDDESFKFDLNDGTAFGRQLSGLRIESFVDDSSALKNLKTFGLDKPVGVLTVSMAGQGEQQLQIGKVAKKAGQEDDKYYAKASDAKGVYELNAAAAKALLKRKLGFLNKQLPFQFDLSQAQTVELVAKGRSVKIIKDLAKWSLTEANEGESLDVAKLESFLSDLKSLSARDYLPSQKGLKFDNRVVIRSQDGSEILNFAWTKKQPDDSMLTGVSSLVKTPFTLSAAKLTALSADQFFAKPNSEKASKADVSDQPSGE